MAGDPNKFDEVRFLVGVFPLPGPSVAKAYNDLFLTQNGTEDQKRRLGNPADLPHPWDPATCQERRLRWELWLWLDAVAAWVNADYVWEAAGAPVIPDCWPQHPHIVHELAVLADQRRRCQIAPNSDHLENWHRLVLPGFLDRMKQRLKSSCDDTHQPWPARSRYTRHTSDRAGIARTRAFEADLKALHREDDPAPTRAPLILVTEGGDQVNGVTGEFV
jgi:hypothetical protein